MPQVGIRELKNDASEIIRAVREERAEYVVTLRGRPVAFIVPVDEGRQEAEATRRAAAIRENAAFWDRMAALGAEIASQVAKRQDRRGTDRRAKALRNDSRCLCAGCQRPGGSRVCRTSRFTLMRTALMQPWMNEGAYVYLPAIAFAEVAAAIARGAGDERLALAVVAQYNIGPDLFELRWMWHWASSAQRK